jgi:acyl carrier protein
VEEIVAAIWQRLLGVERIGRHDDFFALGGHSILAMQVTARIRSAFSVEVPMTSLFEFPTIQQLSAQLDQLRQMRLLNEVEEGGYDIEELFERVSSMPETKVRELMQELAAGGKL